MQAVFASCGYREVETPMFEYYDCYAGRQGQIAQENLYKFFDEQGRVLVLRPDFTTSIARMAATKEENSPVPLRYMYTGSVFRAEQTEGARRREFTQSGIALIGSCSAAADAEVIAAATEAVLAAGIEEMTVEIGQVAFFNGLAEQTELKSADAERLRERIDSKDVVGIREILKDLNMDDNIKSLIEELPYLFGDISILDKARVPGLNETSKIALDNLRDIYNLLCEYGFEKYVSIDLGMLQSIDYYTGSIFKFYTHGVGFPICAGGRYDRLMGNFGAPKGAVGAAIGINRLMQALGRTAPADRGVMMMFAEKGAAADAHELSSALRDCGYIIENYINGYEYSEAVKLGKMKGIACIIRVYTDGTVELHVLENGSITRTDINEFISIYADNAE
ncbi:MAG: ATP phosphoribosyltransferase regulatory subunit [Firmicutes bacterium]|nr:ATP phosphoribosyltransferase regulatory subunit [Bacillota bacterium]